MNTRIILCQTHIFKDIANKTYILIRRKRMNEINYDIGNRIKTAFLFCFTVLQNSVSVSELDKNLNEIQ